MEANQISQRLDQDSGAYSSNPHIAKNIYVDNNKIILSIDHDNEY